MSEIEEAVAKAIAAEVDNGPVSYDALHYSYEKAKSDYHCLARAAIQAYEAAKRISVPTAYYFNGIPVSDLNREQQEEYLAYMKKLGARL